MKKLQETSFSQSVIPGSGPRHMIFSHDGKYCYLVNEISNSIMVYQYHDGHFTLIQVIHCVPRHFHGFSSAAAIHMTSSGKHIIVSNRGHDSIVLYRVNQETGKITLLYMVHTGKGPRDFNIIDDRYIVVASQEEDRLELYTFNEEKEEIEAYRKYFRYYSTCLCGFIGERLWNTKLLEILSLLLFVT